MKDAYRRAAESLGAPGEGGGQDLIYLVELWNLPRTEVERVIARADTMVVARAIFQTAASENPARLIVLRRGGAILDQRGGGD